MPSDSLHNEPQLIREMQSGCEVAFTLLYRKYSPALYINIKKMVQDPVVAEELIQELFTRCWKSREAKGIAENFSGYLHRIAQNLVFDFFKKMKKDQLLLQRFSAWMAERPVEKNAEDELQERQAFAIIHNAIEHLPVQQKHAYKLVRVEGYSYKKAAESMGISPLTVKEYLALANKSIRHYIHKKVESPHELLYLLLVSLAVF